MAVKICDTHGPYHWYLDECPQCYKSSMVKLELPENCEVYVLDGVARILDGQGNELVLGDLVGAVQDVDRPSPQEDNFLALRKMFNSMERDPSGKPPREGEGAKNDDGKISMRLIQQFDLALAGVCDVGTFGNTKYAFGSWRYVENGFDRYSDAMFGHFLKENQEHKCIHTRLLHMAQGAWCALARLQFYIESNPVVKAQYMERRATHSLPDADKLAELIMETQSHEGGNNG